MNLSSQSQQNLNNFPTLVSPPTDRPNLSIEHQKNMSNVRFYLKSPHQNSSFL